MMFLFVLLFQGILCLDLDEEVLFNSTYPTDIAFYPATQALSLEGIAAGNQVGVIEVNWALVETSAGVYDFSSVTSQIGNVQNSNLNYYEIIFTVVTPSGLNIPTIYSSLSWDQRVVPFVNMANVLLTSWNINVHYILIGTDIDYYFGVGNTTTTNFDEFIAFYVASYPFLKAFNSVPITTSLSYYTLSRVSSSTTSLNVLFPYTDVIAFSYYLYNPVDNNVRRPEVVTQELRRVLFNPIFIGKQFVITHCGHSSSSSSFSSTEDQRLFVENVYQIALTYPSSIYYLRFDYIIDLSVSDALLIANKTYVLFGPIDSGHLSVAFFTTIGMKSTTGIEKPSWCLFKEINYRRGLGSSESANTTFCISALSPVPTDDYNTSEYATAAIFFFCCALFIILLLLFMTPHEIVNYFKISKPREV